MNKYKLRLLVTFSFIVFLIAVYFVVNGYLSQLERVETASAQIADVKAEIAKVESQYKSLTSDQNHRLALAEAEMEVQTSLILDGNIGTNQVVASVLNLGEYHNVQVIPLSTSGWAETKFGSHNYRVFQMTIKITGPWSRLIDFLTELQNFTYDTLAYNRMSTVATSVQEKGNTYEATLSLVVYTRNPELD